MRMSEKTSDFLNRHGMLPRAIDLPKATLAFLNDMEAGLSGKESPIRMIPTFLSAAGRLPLDTPVAVIDAGGTHFRTALLCFTKAGPQIEGLEVGPMPGSQGEISWDELVDIAARRLLPLLGDAAGVGFSFSYPIEATPSLDGRLLHLAKQVRISGYAGRLIGADLSARLLALGAGERRVVLLNDTVATLLSGAYRLRDTGGGLVGLICGTGINTACGLDTALIKKPPGLDEGEMIINLESGGFNGLPRGDYDHELDAATADPGLATYEKMVSGAYIGEVCRLTLAGAARDGLFSPGFAERVLALSGLSAPDASLLADGRLPPCLGDAQEGDQDSAREICAALFDRAARCTAANLAAILILADAGRRPEKPAHICVDGSLFNKSAAFRNPLVEYIRSFCARLLGRHAVFYSQPDATLLGTAAAALLHI